ncbi:hypothetical protein [Allgaiera indica]|uniref:hypothetical protein n=1 Tax=Allgaiera indica TaxID=765699 RepID=UPI00115FA181|nr:hypothetical protein [Allgaiera indica]
MRQYFSEQLFAAPVCLFAARYKSLGRADMLVDAELAPVEWPGLIATKREAGRASGNRSPPCKIRVQPAKPCFIEQPIRFGVLHPMGREIGLGVVEQVPQVGSEFFHRLISKPKPKALVKFVASAGSFRQPPRIYQVEVLVELQREIAKGLRGGHISRSMKKRSRL